MNELASKKRLLFPVFLVFVLAGLSAVGCVGAGDISSGVAHVLTSRSSSEPPAYRLPITVPATPAVPGLLVGPVAFLVIKFPEGYMILALIVTLCVCGVEIAMEYGRRKHRLARASNKWQKMWN